MKCNIVTEVTEEEIKNLKQFKAVRHNYIPNTVTSMCARGEVRLRLAQSSPCSNVIGRWMPWRRGGVHTRERQTFIFAGPVPDS